MTHAIILVAVGSESRTVTIPTFDWQMKFEKMRMKNIPNITEIYHFKIRKDDTGKIITKKSVESDVLYFNFFINIPADFSDMLKILRPTGLTQDRQVYLFI
mgnify:CR=1 FL=1